MSIIKQTLHWWINDHGEIQIEQNNGTPTVKAALCLMATKDEIYKVLHALIEALDESDGDSEGSFPGRMITLTEEP